MSGSTVSHTEVDTYRRCQKRWDYRYKQRLKRVRKHIRLVRGEILHDMLHAYTQRKVNKQYAGADPWDVLENFADEFKDYFEEERELHGDIIGDCGEIFEGYLRRWRRDPLKYQASEVAVFFDLPGKLPRFIGFIDKIATDEEKRKWLMDHKIVDRIPTAEDRFAELQLLLYWRAWEILHPDDPLDGVCWDYARAKAPRVPQELKGGGLSKDKRIDTDWRTYKKAIRDNKLDVADYEEMEQVLAGKEDTFYERVFLPKPPKALVDQVWDDFISTATEIQGKKSKGARCTRTMNPFNCNGCDFRPLCEAEVRGHDTDFIIKSDYRQREITGD